MQSEPLQSESLLKSKSYTYDDDDEYKEITLYEYIKNNKDVIDNLVNFGYDDPTIKDLNNVLTTNLIKSTPILFRGTNDYRDIKIGETVFIPNTTIWTDLVMGSGLYATPQYESAQGYAIGASQPYYSGGKGCAKYIFLLNLALINNNYIDNFNKDDETLVIADIKDYEDCKGILLKEKKNYSEDKWKNLIKNKNFIVNITERTGSEIVFLNDINGKLKYVNITKLDSDICKKKINYMLKTEYYNKSDKKHDCIENKIPKECPTTCEFLKSNKELPENINKDGKKAIVNCDTGEFDYKDDPYRKKYLKYKQKYLKLKKINN